MRGLLILGFAVVFAAFSGCNDSVMTPSPPPAGPPPFDPPEPPAEPPHDRGREFQWEGVRGYLLFPGTQLSATEIEAIDNKLRGRWLGKIITYNVCSETALWAAQGAPWPSGPPALSPENKTNLRRFLDTTARLGSQVKLNIFCTVRDNAVWMRNHGAELARMVGNITGEYDHVTVSIANEYYHPASAIRDGRRLREFRDILRLAGFHGLIGTDDNVGCLGCDMEYNGDLRALGFIPDFHPYRSPNPTRNALRRIARENGFAVISEPVAYSKTRTGRCCTDSKEEIRRYMCDAEAEGLVWFHHSTDGLEGVLPSWVPGGVC